MAQEYTFRAKNTNFDLDSRYEPLKPIGYGSFGMVISANEVATGRKVAIKKIQRAFDDPLNAKRILREIMLMKRFNHENIVSLIDMIPPSSKSPFEDVYLVEDLMETDLHRVIYSKQSLSLDHVQCFMYQILRGLKYIHSANVLHRDLKPR
jgi:mitogen-activated protein kinase 1/3